LFHHLDRGANGCPDLERDVTHSERLGSVKYSREVVREVLGPADDVHRATERLLDEPELIGLVGVTNTTALHLEEPSAVLQLGLEFGVRRPRRSRHPSERGARGCRPGTS